MLDESGRRRVLHRALPGKEIGGVREFIIGPQDDGRRLDRWICREMPALGMGQRQKYLRLKRFKIDGSAAQGDYRLQAGQRVQVYLNDKCFEKPRREDPFLAHFKPQLRIVFEDEHLLLVDKKPGLMVHADARGHEHTLLDHLRAYLYQQGTYGSTGPQSFAPALCNRIDRFTGGLVIAAKDEAALKAVNAKIRARQVRKFYLCIVHGAPDADSGLLESYLIKPQGAKKTLVCDGPQNGGKLARTRYQVLAQDRGLSLILCELLTGYTHQIRAQFAHAGLALLGDGQYGDPRRDQGFDQGYQALCAVGLVFDFPPDGGVLSAYAKKAFCVSDVPFARRFFPNIPWRSALESAMLPQ